MILFLDFDCSFFKRAETWLATPFVACIVVISSVSRLTSLILLLFCTALLISFSHPVSQMLDGCLVTDGIGVVVTLAPSVDGKRVAILSLGISQFTELVVNVTQ